MTEEIRYTEAVGRRKTASARVRLYPGTGDIVVNEKPMEEYLSLIHISEPTRPY